MPSAEPVVVRLDAPLALLEERTAAREPSDPAWYLAAARELHESMPRAAIADHVVVNEGTPRAGCTGRAGGIGWLP